MFCKGWKLKRYLFTGLPNAFLMLGTTKKYLRNRSVSKQNWNSGCLWREDLFLILDILLEMCHDNVYAVDVTGEFSPVKISGWFRQLLHHLQHSESENQQIYEECNRINESTNLKLIAYFEEKLSKKWMWTKDFFFICELFAIFGNWVHGIYVIFCLRSCWFLRFSLLNPTNVDPTALHLVNVRNISQGVSAFLFQQIRFFVFHGFGIFLWCVRVFFFAGWICIHFFFGGSLEQFIFAFDKYLIRK